MSGGLSPALSRAALMHAGAALGVALRAEAAAKGVSIGQAARNRYLSGRKAAEAVPETDSLPGRIWRAMPLQARWLTCVRATERADADAAARLPWESFTSSEQVTMSAFARSMQRAFADAGSLF
ncbi:hypothetical protein [Roseateles violae]|uniref:Uncharacterized protein n=1 Tax=Roseateles violae TaxID=3058042 RepID=A0ABT8E0E1_9BURK|nr:hypothetical protein [Pelomonas sp. PFR6]MDN3923303.1 hypothetical protein [Pelomonas sp. PFR6]